MRGRRPGPREARPQNEGGLDVVGECRRAGAGAGGPFWGWGRSGRVRPAGATRNHPHRYPSRATATTVTPGHVGAMIEGTPRPCIPLQWRPPSSPTPLPPGIASATPRGEPAASPPHRALPPGHSRLIPCSSSALPSCMGEDLSPTQDPRQGRFQAISDVCGTAHQH